MAKKATIEVNESNVKAICLALINTADMINFEMEGLDREAPYNMKTFCTKINKLYSAKDFEKIQKEMNRQERLMRSVVFDY